MIRVHHLFISPGHNFFGHHGEPAGEHPIMEVDSVECVAGRGLYGDRFFDYKRDYKGQITFFSMEVFEALRHALALDSAKPGATRRNVFLSGVELDSLVCSEFEVQGVTFAGSGECAPCHWMDQALGPGAEAWLKGRGGAARTDPDGWRVAPRVSFTAVILAGGQSRRMGRDKALIEFEGQTLIARALSLSLKAGATELLISGRKGVNYKAPGITVISDAEPGLGPIGGIERGLLCAANPTVLFLAVDMPRMRAELLQRLAAVTSDGLGIVPVLNGELEPLAAIYTRPAHAIAVKFLQSSRLSARDFANECVQAGISREFQVPHDLYSCFENWNLPRDTAP